MKSLAVLAIGAAALIGVSACSSDKKLGVATEATSAASNPDVSNPDISIPDSLPDISIPSDLTIPDISLPTDISFPANISDDCKNFYLGIASAMSGGDKKTFDNLAKAMNNLKDSVPDDLRDDMDVVSQAYTKLAAIYAKYNYDLSKAATDPDLQKFFSDPKFSQSSDNISNWLESECGSGNG